MYSRTEEEIMQKWKGDLNTPIVSICCTTYNHEPYIAEAINGFLMQETDFPFEILIRDDCSTDNTVEIVKQYYNQYPNLIKPVFEKENTYSKGVKPMPQLYQRAKGKYIALCEGDDYWTDPLKLQKQVEFLKGSGEYVGVGHQSIIIDEFSNIKQNFYRQNIPEILTTKDFLEECPFQTATFLFQADIVKRYPVTIDYLSGDKIIMLLVSRFGLIKYMNIPMSHYRQHSEGMSSIVTFDMMKKDLNIIPWITEFDPSFPKYRYASHIHKTIIFFSNNINFTSKMKHFIWFSIESFSYFPKNIPDIIEIFYSILASKVQLRTRLRKTKENMFKRKLKFFQKDNNIQ